MEALKTKKNSSTAARTDKQAIKKVSLSLLTARAHVRTHRHAHTHNDYFSHHFFNGAGLERRAKYKKKESIK
jgi:hypothetical protein